MAVLTLSICEVVSSSPDRADCVKPKKLNQVVIAPLPRAQHSEVRLTGLSDMTKTKNKKTEAPCRGTCGTFVCLFTVLRPVQEFFTYMPVKGYKI
jgi:hypothetical protein